MKSYHSVPQTELPILFKEISHSPKLEKNSGFESTYIFEESLLDILRRLDIQEGDIIFEITSLSFCSNSRIPVY